MMPLQHWAFLMGSGFSTEQMNIGVRSIVFVVAMLWAAWVVGSILLECKRHHDTDVLRVGWRLMRVAVLVVLFVVLVANNP